MANMVSRKPLRTTSFALTKPPWPLTRFPIASDSGHPGNRTVTVALNEASGTPSFRLEQP